MKKFNSGTKDEGSAQRLRYLEEAERQKLGNSAWTLSPEIMNMMTEMCDHDHDPIRIFNWCKRILNIRKQPNGIVLEVDELAFNNILGKIPEALMGYFQTRNIALIYNNRINYMADPEKRKEPLSLKAVELFRRAQEFNLPPMTDDRREELNIPRWAYKPYPQALEDGSIHEFVQKYQAPPDAPQDKITACHKYIYEWLTYAAQYLAYPRQIAEDYARKYHVAKL